MCDYRSSDSEFYLFLILVIMCCFAFGCCKEKSSDIHIVEAIVNSKQVIHNKDTGNNSYYISTKDGIYETSSQTYSEIVVGTKYILKINNESEIDSMFVSTNISLKDKILEK